MVRKSQANPLGKSFKINNLDQTKGQKVKRYKAKCIKHITYQNEMKENNIFWIQIQFSKES